jgi:septal ring factor EnvC (AmiA/AmiB activator)
MGRCRWGELDRGVRRRCRRCNIRISGHPYKQRNNIRNDLYLVTLTLKGKQMAKKKTNTITINDVEYTEDQLTNEQKTLVNHATDLDRKIASTRFNLDQLQVGKEAFVNILAASLEAPIQDAEVIN